MLWILSVVATLAVVVAIGACVALAVKSRSTEAVLSELKAQVASVGDRARELPDLVRAEARALREEVGGVIAAQQQGLEGRFASAAQAQGDQLTSMRQEASEGRSRLEEALRASSDAFAHAQSTRLGETNQAVKDLAERLETGQQLARAQQGELLGGIANKMETLTDGNAKKLDAIRETLAQSLDLLRKDNETKLEQMRATVEEKLQGTLEARLGESFRLVSDRLELVHKGLGEMQSLASGVGDLKRVLTNVKSRGGWGEVQLSMLLEDMLTREQFDVNVRVRPSSAEIVEFAVRFPGKDDDRPVYLPIDAKFPHEDYDRLLAAQESGNPEEADKAGAALERTVRAQAKVISEKYIHPPFTTDFAIMYLPTEGLFAEVIRRPGLCQALQSQHRVMVTGPTTLAALLNSLQMGFRTLAIEKRSSEVWQVWEKLERQLQTAQNTVTEAGRRTRAVERQLQGVEALPASDDFRSALPLSTFDQRSPEVGSVSG